MGKDDEPRGVGRPARGKEPASTLSLRLNAKERADYEAAAKKTDMSLAEWIRAACAAFLKKAKR